MSSKSKALRKATEESPRSKEVRENNEKSRVSNMKPVWRDRHARRHGEKSKYNHSLKGRQEWMKTMSKDS